MKPEQQEGNSEDSLGPAARQSLLSQALQAPPRAVSLLNLLDQPHPASQLRPPATVSSLPHARSFRALTAGVLCQSQASTKVPAVLPSCQPDEPARPAALCSLRLDILSG